MFRRAPYQAVEQPYLDILHHNVTEIEERCSCAPLCPCFSSCRSLSAGFPNVSVSSLFVQPVHGSYVVHGFAFEVSQNFLLLCVAELSRVSFLSFSFSHHLGGLCLFLHSQCLAHPLSLETEVCCFAFLTLWDFLQKEKGPGKPS